MRTFWHTNHIRNPTASVSGSVDVAQKVSTDAQKVSCTILQDYENDIKKRFRSGDAPARWKGWLESQKTGCKRAAVAKAPSDESMNASSPIVDDSLKLKVSTVPSLSASSASTLEWRMEAFLLASADYQRYVSFFHHSVIDYSISYYHMHSDCIAKVFVLSSVFLWVWVCQHDNS